MLFDTPHNSVKQNLDISVRENLRWFSLVLIIEAHSGRVRTDDWMWYSLYSKKSCALPVFTDSVLFQPAVAENHDADLLSAGKCPHAVIMDFLDMPQLISGKVILYSDKK